MNISAGGAQLAIRKHLPAAARISLEIPCSVGPYKTVGTQVKSNLPARVLNKRTTVDGGACYLLGLKFSRPLINGRKRS